MNFQVGQKVVCVDASPGKWPDMTPLVKGDVYTVAALFRHDLHGLGVQLVEVRMPFKTDWYYAKRFRPAVERRTDISIFTAMLNTQRDKVC